MIRYTWLSYKCGFQIAVRKASIALTMCHEVQIIQQKSTSCSYFEQDTKMGHWWHYKFHAPQKPTFCAKNKNISHLFDGPYCKEFLSKCCHNIKKLFQAMNIIIQAGKAVNKNIRLVFYNTIMWNETPNTNRQQGSQDARVYMQNK